MASKAQEALDKFVRDMNKAVLSAKDQKFMIPLAQFAIGLIVKRTRLGYGVSEPGGKRQKLTKLSRLYTVRRAIFSGLHEATSPTKSNLTLTGQMLDSIKILSKNKQSVIIGPSGRRRGESLTNQKLAQYVTDAGRPFMNLSDNDFRQLVRYFRETFGDLLAKRKIID